MALPAWPSDLPYDWSADVFSRSPARPPISTPVEQGPNIMRVASQTILVRMPFSSRFNSDQHAIWEPFYYDTLRQGVLHFTMPVMLVGRTVVTRRVYIESGTMDDKPFGLQWLVSFQANVFRSASA